MPTSIVGNQRLDEVPVDGTTTTTETITELNNGQGPSATLAAQTNTSEDRQGVSSGVIVSPEVTGTEAAVAPIVETLTPSTQPVAAPQGPNITPPVPTESNGPVESGAAAALVAASVGKSGPMTASTPLPPPASLQSAVGVPFTNAVTTLVRAFGAAGLTLASLPGSQNPVGNVITVVQILLTAVVDAVSEVAHVPGNLLDLLGFPGAVSVPPLFGDGGTLDRKVGTLPGVTLVGNEAQLPTSNVVAMDAPLFGIVISDSQFGGIAPASLSHDLVLSGVAPAPASISPGTASFLDNVVRSVLVPASLTALAAIAVPGIAGLLIVCAAGMRIGYRQARAGLALKLSGIARFAGSGPMGVVRSGSMIALHPRTSKLGKAHGTGVGRDKTAAAVRHLERVA